MGVAVSLVLIAAGAILTWAVTAEAEGIDVNTVGVILLIVGLLGLVLSLIFWSSWGGFHQRGATYVDDGPVRRGPRRRTTVVEDDDVAPGPPGPPLP
jgi:Domain of unknown function (DUF6458)